MQTAEALCMLATKLVVVAFVSVVWLSLAYIQTRVWSELPLYIEKESRVVLPVFGCKECVSTTASSDMSVFLCNGCKHTNNNNNTSPGSRAAMQTANQIGNDVEWIVGGDLLHRMFVSVVFKMAREPGVIASWMLWVQAGLSFAFACWCGVAAFRKSMRQFKVKEGALVPMQSLNSLPTSLHDILNEDDDVEDSFSFPVRKKFQ